MFNNIKDNQVFIDKETQKMVIYHQRSFLYILHGILTHYLRLSFDYALELIKNSNFIDKEECYLSISLTGHELEYHWAMLIAYGHEYWNKGYNSDAPDDYMQWRDDFIDKHNLKPDPIEYPSND